MFEDGANGRPLNRRTFLRRAGGVVIAAPTLGAILASCTKPGAANVVSGASTNLLTNPARPDHPVTLPLWENPIAAGTPIETNATLQVYNWTDYLWPKLFKKFEDQYSKYGVTVQLTTFNDIDEGIQKMSSGQVAADVFFPDPSELTKLAVSKLLKPLNHDLIPNLAANYWPEFQNPFYDQHWHYSVPYTIYTTGIAYRRDHIADSDLHDRSNPYDILWDPKYKGKVTIYDDRRETIGMALLKNGIKDVNTEDPKIIDMARDDILKLVEATNAQLTINGVYSKMPQDEFWVGSSWSGDIVSAFEYYLPKGTPPSVLGYWYPKDGGGMIGNDLMVVPTSGKNPRLAHEFLNFMLNESNSYSNFTVFNGYQTPMNTINPGRLVPKVIPENLAEAIVVPSYFDSGSFLLGLSPTGEQLWNAAWDQIKAGG